MIFFTDSFNISEELSNISWNWDSGLLTPSLGRTNAPFVNADLSLLCISLRPISFSSKPAFFVSSSAFADNSDKVYVITDAKYNKFSLSLKNKYDSDKIKETDVVRLIGDAKQQISRNNKDFAILHLLVDKYIVDGEEYLEFPENKSYKEFIIEISFITIQNSTVKTLNKIFKDCNIEVKKIISHQYSSSFAEKSDISPCIAGKKVIDGINPLEVMTHNLYTKKQGLFEKMFNFF